VVVEEDVGGVGEGDGVDSAGDGGGAGVDLVDFEGAEGVGEGLDNSDGLESTGSVSSTRCCDVSSSSIGIMVALSNLSIFN
jgi:hypothetical protein